MSWNFIHNIFASGKNTINSNNINSTINSNNTINNNGTNSTINSNNINSIINSNGAIDNNSTDGTINSNGAVDNNSTDSIIIDVESKSINNDNDEAKNSVPLNYNNVVNKHTISAEFTKIKSDAESDLDFNRKADGHIELVANHEVKCTVSNDLLLIESKPGINTNFNSGVSISGGFSGGVSISGNKININSRRGGKVYINGRLIDLDNLPDQAETKPDKKYDDYSKKWTLYNKSTIRRVTANSNGNINFSHFELLNSNFSGTVIGKGGLYIPKGNYNAIKANLSGSGKINLGESVIDRFDADLSGSGRIYGFFAKISGVFNLSGSGSISGRAARGCDLDKNKSGSGNISVHQE